MHQRLEDLEKKIGVLAEESVQQDERLDVTEEEIKSLREYQERRHAFRKQAKKAEDAFQAIEEELIAQNKRLDELIDHDYKLAIDLSPDKKDFLHAAFYDCAELHGGIKTKNDVHIRIAAVQDMFEAEYGKRISAACIKESLMQTASYQLPKPAMTECAEELSNSHKEYIYNQFTSCNHGSTMDERLANARTKAEFWLGIRLSSEEVKQVIIEKAYERQVARRQVAARSQAA